MPLLHLQQISIAFGGPPLLEQAQLQIELGERVFIVGRNGEGKSTLLKLIEGVLEPDEGERIVHPDIRIRSLSQEVPEDLTCRLDHLVLEGVDPALEEWEATQAVEQTLSLMQLDTHAALIPSLADKNVEPYWQKHGSLSPICSFLTNRPTIWISRLFYGWKKCYCASREVCSA